MTLPFRYPQKPSALRAGPSEGGCVSGLAAALLLEGGVWWEEMALGGVWEGSSLYSFSSHHVVRAVLRHTNRLGAMKRKCIKINFSLNLQNSALLQ